MHDSIVSQGFHVLDIAPRHTEFVTTLPYFEIGGKEHRDPFGRLLISQALVEGMQIVSNDSKLQAYGVPVIW
jgi:PIN domain nuclease of toxin-antitoxin system